MGKVKDMMVKKTLEQIGVGTPQATIESMNNLVVAIKRYEEVGPIDIRNGEKPTSRQLVALGNLSNALADASIMYDVYLDYHGIEWKAIDRRIQLWLSEQIGEDEVKELAK